MTLGDVDCYSFCVDARLSRIVLGSSENYAASVYMQSHVSLPRVSIYIRRPRSKIIKSPEAAAYTIVNRIGDMAGASHFMRRIDHE